MQPLTFGSVCSGIEAASAAWEPLGMEPAWFSEVAPFPSAVLAHRFPHVPNLGDMTAIEIDERIAAIDVLIGGTPCQAFSVAGLRKSLDDERGNLSLAFCRLARRIADAGRLKFVVWENVPGVLNTSDNAFGCFLAGLVGEPDALRPAGPKWTDAGAVYGPEGAAAWRCLDAQWFGLAQRRKRVFVVFCPGGWTDPAKVLFEWEGVRRDSPPSRPSREGIAASLTRGADSGGRGGYAGRRRADDVNIVAGTLDCRSTAGGFPGTDAACSGYVVPDVCPAIKARDSKGPSSDGDGDGAILVPYLSHSLRGEGFDASEDGTGRGTPLVPDVYPCLRGGNQYNNSDPGMEAAMLVPIDMRQASRGEKMTNNRAAGSSGGAPGTGIGKAGDPSPSLGMSHPPAIAYQCQGTNVGEMGTLRGGNGHLTGGTPFVQQRFGVRRLTPKECERLQGFADNWTLVPYRGKPAADGPRYQALGNSMAVPVIQWIGRRIVTALTPPLQTGKMT